MPPIQRPQPQYRQVADQLRAAIEAGTYPRGSDLPSEPELAAQYGVTRDVVNRAVRMLRSWGLVKVSRGRGSMVNPIPVIHRDGTARYSREARERSGGRGAFDSEIKSLGMAPRSDTTVSTIPAAADVAEALQIEPGAPVIERARRMYADNVAVQLAASYIPADIAEGTPLAEVDSGPGGIISRFAELGHRQVRITESITVRPANAEEAEFLGLEESQAVMEIRHIGWTAEGRPVELAVHSVAAGQWTFDYEFPAT
jgi:GntR family transcriptional regulator